MSTESGLGACLAHLQIELTSESDLFFHYTHTIGAADFQQLMQEAQKLMVDFNSYPAVFLRMVNSCIQTPQTHIAVLLMESSGAARLDFIQVSGVLLCCWLHTAYSMQSLGSTGMKMLLNMLSWARQVTLFCSCNSPYTLCNALGTHLVVTFADTTAAFMSSMSMPARHQTCHVCKERCNLDIAQLGCKACTSLCLSQNMEYKFVELMSCRFQASSEEYIKQQVTYRYNAVKSRLALMQARLADINALVSCR